MANEISTLTDLNGVTHDIEDSTARSAIQTLDGQAVKSVNGQTPTAGAVLIGSGNIGYDNTNSGLTADDVQEAVDELNGTLSTKQDTLTFDTTPTASSTNPVTSGGVKSALDLKADDSAVVKSVNSVNPVTGNVVLNAENIPAEGYGNKSVSGNPITITDGTATTVKNLDVSLTPIQDLHGYANPWPAGGGKNLFDVSTQESGFISADGAINYDGGISSYSALIPVTVGQTYTASGYVDAPYNGNKRVHGYDSNGTWVEQIAYVYASQNTSYSVTFTVPSGISYVRFSHVTDEVRVQIELGSIATSYAPYSNICPISGLSSVSVKRTGKNLFDLSQLGNYDGITYSDGVISGTASAIDANFNKYAIGQGLPNTYSFNGQISVSLDAYTDNITQSSDDGLVIGIIYTDGTTDSIRFPNATTSYTRKSVVTNANKSVSYISMSYYASGASGNTWYIRNMQIEYGSTPTAYEPYQGSTATITLGQTVYQGTVDFDTGLMTVTHALVEFDGSNDESWSTRTTTGGYTLFEISLQNCNVPQSSDPLAITNKYAWLLSLENNKVFRIASSVLSVREDGLTLEQFQQLLSADGLQVVYPLATPTTVQLTPAQLTLLEGYNYITTDANSISLDYYGSEATNVQDEINEFETNLDRLAGSIAQIEVSPATATHKVGDLIVWNSQLYRVTSAIAVGETLSVGSNLAFDSVGDEFSLVKGKLTVKTYEGTAITDSDGDFTIGGSLTRNNSIFIDIVGVRDASGYASWHGFVSGSGASDSLYSFKAIKDNGDNLGSQSIHYKFRYFEL